MTESLVDGLRRRSEYHAADLIEELEAERGALQAALRNLTFMVRTSAGTAGRDVALCAACDEAEKLLPERGER